MSDERPDDGIGAHDPGGDPESDEGERQGSYRARAVLKLDVAIEEHPAGPQIARGRHFGPGRDPEGQRENEVDADRRDHHGIRPWVPHVRSARHEDPSVTHGPRDDRARAARHEDPSVTHGPRDDRARAARHEDPSVTHGPRDDRARAARGHFTAPTVNPDMNRSRNRL